MQQETSYSATSGFTMVELAITLSVLSIIAATVMMETLSASAVKGQEITLQRMAAIERELTKHYQVFFRIPCPSGGDASVDETPFGKEDGDMGDCTSGAGEMLGPAGNVVMGGVPVKALNLADEYAFDGWGRRIMYVVDQRRTDKRLTHPVPAAVNVYDASGGTLINAYPALLISFGKLGHGAFPASGSAVADRMDTMTPNAHEQENAHFTSAFNANFVLQPFRPDLPETSPTPTIPFSYRFDQIVKPVSLE